MNIHKAERPLSRIHTERLAPRRIIIKLSGRESSKHQENRDLSHTRDPGGDDQEISHQELQAGRQWADRIKEVQEQTLSTENPILSKSVLQGTGEIKHSSMKAEGIHYHSICPARNATGDPSGSDESNMTAF